MIHTFAQFILIYPGIPICLLLILGCMIRWFCAPNDRKRTQCLLVVFALAIPATRITEWAANSLSRLRPFKYDQFVYSISSILGNPSFVIGRFAEYHTWMHNLIGVSYGLLAVAIVGVFAAYVYLCSEADVIEVIKAFLLNLFVAVPIYLIFPVCGPAFAFKTFPQAPPPFVPHLVAIHAAPNGVPSVHMSTAILVLAFLWRWRWGRVLGVTFLALTILATLGSGQHYIFDLICAVPYAWAIWVVSHYKPATVPVTEAGS